MVDDPAASPELDDDELAELEALGTRRQMVAGEYFYREGDADYDFFVILSGETEVIYLASDGQERVVTRHGRGRFLGELNMLTGDAGVRLGRACRARRALVVPAASLRHVLATKAHWATRSSKAFMARRSILLEGSYSSIRARRLTVLARGAARSESSWPGAGSPSSGWTLTQNRTVEGSSARRGCRRDEFRSSSCRERFCAIRPPGRSPHIWDSR